MLGSRYVARPPHLLALTSDVCVCACMPAAPLSSALCQKYSCRKVVFIGGVFCALGLTLSYFAASLVHLFFTFGVLTGNVRHGP